MTSASPLRPPSANLLRLVAALPRDKFFKVLPRRDDYLVTFRDTLAREKEIYRWFRKRGHQPRFINGQRHKGRYVKCSRDIALLAKLTWGGAF